MRHTHKHTYTRTSTHTHTHAHTRTRMRMHARTHTRTHANTRVHAQTHAHTHTHACTHTPRTHTHTHHARTQTHHARTHTMGYIVIARMKCFCTKLLWAHVTLLLLNRNKKIIIIVYPHKTSRNGKIKYMIFFLFSIQNRFSRQ